MADWNYWSPIRIKRRGDPKAVGDRATKRMSSTGGNVATSFLRVAERESFERKTLTKLAILIAIGSILSCIATTLILAEVLSAPRSILVAHLLLASLFVTGLFVVARAPFATTFGLASVQVAFLAFLAVPQFRDAGTFGLVFVTGPTELGIALFNLILWWNMKDAIRVRLLRQSLEDAVPRKEGRSRRLRLVSIPTVWRVAIGVGVILSGALFLLNMVGNPYPVTY